MAEAIASGITIGALAIGIAKSATKLKSTWDQVRDAPDDILYLVGDLERISYMLAEDFQQRDDMSSLVLDSVSISRCLQRCKEEVDRLKELIDGLSNNLEHPSKFKKRWAAAKTVLKKDQINRYRARLDGTLRTLTLAHQMYMQALLQLLPDIIITKLSIPPKNEISGTALYGYSGLNRPSATCQEVTVLDEIASSEIGTSHYNQAWPINSLFGRLHYRKHNYAIYNKGETIEHRKKQEIEERIAEYWTPSWIAHRLWRLRAFKALSGWTIYLQTYNVIPEDSLAITYASENNVKGLQELFSRREASPFDCFSSGGTLLIFTIWCGSLDACRFLIEEGADIDYKYGKRPALDWFEWFDQDAMDTSGLWQLLLAKTDREVDLGNFLGSSKGFSHWQQTIDPLYYQRRFEERLAVAFSLARSPNRPDVVRRALSLGSLPPLTYAERGGLLIYIAGWVGCWVYPANHNTAWVSKSWGPFLKELIVDGAHLHYIDASFETPLIFLLMESINSLRHPDEIEEASQSESLHFTLSTWLKGLQECGVNLEEYGEEEIHLHDQGLVSWSWYWSEWCSTLILTGLTYGPQPSDWKITWEFRDKDTPYIPGGWIGDDDGDDEDGSIGDEEEEYSAEDDEEEYSAEDEDEDDSIGEVYEDCSVGDGPEVSARAVRTE